MNNTFLRNVSGPLPTGGWEILRSTVMADHTCADALSTDHLAVRGRDAQIEPLQQISLVLYFQAHVEFQRLIAIEHAYGIILAWAMKRDVDQQLYEAIKEVSPEYAPHPLRTVVLIAVDEDFSSFSLEFGSEIFPARTDLVRQHIEKSLSQLSAIHAVYQLGRNDEDIAVAA